MSISTRALAEFFGTFWLVFGGCGSALFAAAYPQLGIGFAGVALAFGLTLLTMAFAIGHISGAHLNPAVSFGLFAGGRFPARDLVPYIVAQVLGGIAASGCLYIIASGKEGFSRAAGFASNGYGVHSPGGYSLARLLRRRIPPHRLLPAGHPRLDRRAGPQRLRPHRHRPLPHPHPSRIHPDYEYLRQPRTLYRSGDLSGNLGALTALALLGRADRRRHRRRPHLPRSLRRSAGAHPRGNGAIAAPRNIWCPPPCTEPAGILLLEIGPHLSPPQRLFVRPRHPSDLRSRQAARVVLCRVIQAACRKIQQSQLRLGNCRHFRFTIGFGAFRCYDWIAGGTLSCKPFRQPSIPSITPVTCRATERDPFTHS